MRTCSRYTDNNFAKMRSRGHVPVDRLRLTKLEYLIAYRLMPLAAIARLIASNICIEQCPHHISQAGSQGGPPALTPNKLGTAAGRLRGMERRT